jgi:hypothetical protein
VWVLYIDSLLGLTKDERRRKPSSGVVRLPLEIKTARLSQPGRHKRRRLRKFSRLVGAPE